MGRVETRMYKRKRQRRKTARLVLLILLLIGGGMLLWVRLPGGLHLEHIGLPTSTPISSSFDQTTDTREVMLAAETWYAIQTGVFSTREAAEQKADAYTERGAPGTVIQDGEKWRVFIACYGTEEQAASVRTRLEQNQKVDTYLYAWKCPELRLRLSGMIGQMDVVEAGFTLMTSSAAAIRDVAIQLDAGELTTAETSSAVGDLISQMALWRNTTASRFGIKTPEMVQAMLTMMDSWGGKLGQVKAAETATALSANLKACAMGMFDDMITWRKGFAAQ